MGHSPQLLPPGHSRHLRQTGTLIQLPSSLVLELPLLELLDPELELDQCLAPSSDMPGILALSNNCSHTPFWVLPFRGYGSVLSHDGLPAPLCILRSVVTMLSCVVICNTGELVLTFNKYSTISHPCVLF